MSAAGHSDLAKVAVVTGAGGGIGRAISAALLGRGFVVVATDSSSAALDGLPDGPGRLIRQRMDVRCRAEVEAVAGRLAADPGGVSVLVSNAGVFRKGPLLGLDEAATRDVVDVNLLGTLWCLSAFGSVMAQRGAGRIITIASIAGVTGAALSVAYAASKAGVIAATRSAARELGSRGVSVVAVAPGPCDTPMLAADRILVERFVVPRVPLGRVAQPEEVAEVVAFLAASDTSYFNGAVLTFDGGLHVG
jgi:NAD(P)-dependent dehydrogenase (short-subunit alcohol dehydrogenase family)